MRNLAAGGIWNTQEAGTLLLRVGLADSSYDHKDTIRIVMEAAAHRLRIIPSTVSRRGAEVKDFIAADPATQMLLSLVGDLAVLDGVGPRSKNQPLMILGERGTGKELIARACHVWSNRAGNPFIAINVGAIDRNLVVSEIFGYRKGAFTGAQSDRRGYVQAAAGGTLFLDEIDEADGRTQGLLKRVIQFGTYQVVGDAEEQKADVRIIAATNRVASDDMSIKEDVRDRFWPIVVPPLRERRGDIRPLAQFFAQPYAYELPETVLDWLETLEWPGNVRQLQNTVERACALCHTPDELTLEFFEKCMTHIGGKALYRVASGDPTFFPLEPGETLTQREEKDLRRYIEYALRVSNGNRQHTADMLGRSRQWLGERMKKLGIKDILR
ncbi:MAG: sigma-54-dependent Fis family transcriptional regulator [Pyrinomonadaceae bacterium]|nr:sigma-54-dependent Fis family transcriptional regulator [Pyrinomonadaceae bacterium]